MNNLNQKFTKENTADKSAVEEKEFTGYSLIEELIPLLKDYFECEMKLRSNDLLMRFYNGQQFRLVIDNVSDK